MTNLLLILLLVVGCSNDYCGDNTACNFNPYADFDDDSCAYSTVGCADPNAYNYNAYATTPCNSGADNDCCEY